MKHSITLFRQIQQPLTRLSSSSSINNVLKTGITKRGVWSNTLSYSSPEADFTSIIRDATLEQQPQMTQHEWSSQLSYTSPESDFTAVSATHSANNKEAEEQLLDIENQWSGILKFSSPESDFTALSSTASPHNTYDEQEDPATDTYSQEDFINHIESNERHRNTMAYSLAFASADSDFCSSNVQNLLNDRMKMQLDHVENQFKKYQQPKQEQEQAQVHASSLPTTLQNATQPNDPRAIVVTEAVAPFRIVAVNDAWENLCGYTQDECYGKTLECIQGPQTSRNAAQKLMSRVVKGDLEEASTVLMNYNKNGDVFKNYLRIGPLMSDGDDSKVATHFVGVLKDISNQESGKKMTAFIKQSGW